MNFVTNSMINAVSWTLIHSLWLGLILALLAGLTILLTKKATSAFRYNILAALCVAFLVTMGFTFNHELNQQKSMAAKASVSGKLPALSNTKHVVTLDPISVTSIIGEPAEAEESMTMQASRFVNKYASWIVFLWFMIFIIKCIRMANGISQIYRVRNYQTVEPPEFWQKRLQELKSLMNINGKVTLLESKLVNIPSVTGFFKPIILVPIGLINNLQAEQVEAILLHELAHIRRSDYFVNLIQSFMEIFFFFNPGVLWLSSLLKEERENCCDDLAISVTNNKKEFVNALVSFQEYNLSGQGLAMQFGNQKMSLATRAKRILFNDKKGLNKIEKSLLSVCIVLGSLLCFAFANSTPQSKLSKYGNSTVSAKAFPPDSLVGLDTLHVDGKYNAEAFPEGTAIRFVDVIKGKETTAYIFKHKGNLYQVPEGMIPFRLNGKLISGKDAQAYLPVLETLVEGYEERMAEAREIEEESVRIEEESRRIEADSRRIEADSRRIEDESRRIEADSRRIEHESRRIEEESRQIERESRRIEMQSARIEADSRKIEADSRKIETESRKIEKESRKIEIDAARIEAEATKAAAEAEAQSDNYVKVIMGELKKAGYKEKDIRSFSMDNNKLSVNGKKQSAELHAKIKKQMPGKISVQYSSSSTTTND